MNMKIFVRRSLSATKRIIKNLMCMPYKINDEIILESNPDFACNTFAVYKELVRRGINKKYRLTWMLDADTRISKDLPFNVSVLVRGNDRKSRRRNYIRCNRAVCVICCNRHIQNNETNRKQLNIYLGHGSPLKRLKTNDGRPDKKNCSYIISQSDFFNPIMADQFGVRPEKIITLGVPRNDQLFNEEKKLTLIGIEESDYKKIIAWVPTFREHKGKTRIDAHSNFKYGLPLLKSKEDILKLDTFLKENNCLVIIKPHPAQDLDVIKELDCSNIRLLYDDFMLNHGLQTNELLSRTDAMVTDYSGIYYDYLLLDKPIGLSLDDYEIYKTEKGFCYKDPLDILKGQYLYDANDLICFINNVIYGKDKYFDERSRVKYLTNKYCDNNSTKRVVDFIIEELEKRRLK